MYSIHKSCKSGKTPDNEYSSKCQRSGNTTSKLQDKNLFYFQRLNTNNVSEFSCAKFAGEGNIGDKKVKITSRNCIQFKEDETCGKTSTAAIKEELELPQEVADFLEASKFSFSVCTCNSGDCNSGLKLKVLQYLVFMSVCISKINSYFSL